MKLSQSFHSIKRRSGRRGFTIVELLIVIVVIAILAAITTVAYNGISRQTREASIKEELANSAKQLHVIKVNTGSFPSDTSGVVKSDDITFQYSGTTNEFCLVATSSALPGKSFYIRESGTILEGNCPPAPIATGDYLQDVTTARCPETRVLVRDARDNRSYWIQKLADGKCWMLTNLAYTGGGDNTYGDVVSTATLTEGAVNSAATFTEARYYVISNANPTTYPAAASTATDGGASGRQYGYLYNKCAASGAQFNTTFCSSGYLAGVNINRSLCGSGWRLPNGGSGYAASSTANVDFQNLNRAVNNGSDTTSAGLLQNWLIQYSGRWTANGTYSSLNSSAHLWAVSDSSGSNSWHISMSNTAVGTVGLGSYATRSYGLAVRCIATN